jgi:hypothetical protein
MITWLTMLAVLAMLAWRSAHHPHDMVSLGQLLVFAGVLMTAALSNRIQRRFRAMAARAIYGVWFEGREERRRALAPLQRVRTLEEFMEQLPDVTVAAAGVEPVTLFALDDDGSHYLPVSSTVFPIPAAPVAADDPLAVAMRRSPRVHYLKGRTDDLQYAPIFAVNGRQLEECQAVCALPLHRNGALAAFLLCGGTGGDPRLGMLSSSCLEGLGQRYADLMKRFPGAELTIAEGLTPTGPLTTQRSVNA